MRVFFSWHSLVEPEYRKYLKELSASGCQVKGVCPKQWTECGEAKSVKEAVNDQGYELFALKTFLTGHIRSFGYLEHNFLKQLLSGYKPEVIHIFEEPYSISCYQLLSIAKQLNPRPKIIIESFENIFCKHPFPFSAIETHNLKIADALISVPKEGMELWRKKGFLGQVFNLPVGIDDKVFFRKESAKNDAVRFCYVGRIVEEKGIKDLLASFSELSLRYKNIELYIAGSGALKNELSSKNTNNKIKFTDPINNSELPEFYSSMDILVLPSLTTKNWKEQFGRVLIEAMSCGLAVIGSSSGEIPNVIGDSGIIFDEGNNKSLYTAMETLAINFDILFEYKKKAKERVTNNYTWANITKKTISIYEQITKY
jgi:glycosyltransferase involved in cell wall biosynthesis